MTVASSSHEGPPAWRQKLAKRVSRAWAWASTGRRPEAILLSVGLVFSLGAGAGWGAWQNLCHDCPSIARITTWEPEQTSKLLSHDGRLIAEIGLERRTPIPLQALPEYVPQAFLAIEDKRFYKHRGYDIRGILRSAVRVLLNRSFAGGGGSTITQQLARNMFEERIGREKRILRKLKELQVALALEEAYPKDKILEAYINQINYDRGWYGIQTAARNYFGKNATQVNPAEAAMLAAIPNLPAYYNPLRHPDNALRRRNLTLDLMVDQGFLTKEEGERWKAWPLPDGEPEAREGLAPYFQEWVRQMLDDRFGDLLYTGGLRIHTTLDLEMQAAARISMDEGWAAIEARPGFGQPKYEDWADHPDPLEEAETPYLQGAFVALEPSTGAVRAMIGGRDFRHSKFNRATQALRQAGSSFKPFVYTSAIASGIPASHILVDAPVVLPQVSGEEWKPQNFDEEFQGEITIREGLRRSINMIAIKLGIEVGLETVAQTAWRMGIRTEVERFPSTAIGAAEVIPLEMAEAYSTLASLGTRVHPHPILRVENAEGEILWEPEVERFQVLDPQVARIMVSLLEDVVARGTGYTGIRLLSGLPYEIPAAGKTGTTNDGTDVWFMGFTPNLMAGIWFGMDRPVSFRPNATGGADASPVWGAFMKRVYYGEDPDSTGAGEEPVADSLLLPDLPGTAFGAGQVEADTAEVFQRTWPLIPFPEPWPMVDGIVSREVDSKTGLLASPWCPAERAYQEIFLPGTEPKEYCDMSSPRIFRMRPERR